MEGFVPRTSEKQQITIRIDTYCLKTIDKIATETNISRSELINQCLDYALNSMKANSKM